MSCCRSGKMHNEPNGTNPALDFWKQRKDYMQMDCPF
jgi:hypothetical protein